MRLWLLTIAEAFALRMRARAQRHADKWSARGERWKRLYQKIVSWRLGIGR